MFRFMRKREGFTLIELMMVVAVIGILAAVLIPKIGGTKTSAKETGVDTNVRIVQALVESKISKYDANIADAKKLEDYLITKIDGFTGAEEIKNPMTDSTVVTNMAAALSATCAVANFVDDGVVAGDTSTTVAAWPVSGDTDYAGVVGIAAYVSGTNLKVDIIPYDSGANKGTVVTVTK